MRSLYLKIFIWFWLVMILAVLCIAWLSFQFSQEKYLPLQQQNLISNYAVTALITYEINGKPGLQRWFTELEKRFSISAHLVDENGQDILAGQLNDREKKISEQIHQQIAPIEAFRENNIIVSPLIHANNGNIYRLILTTPTLLQPLQYIHSRGLLYGLLIALVLSGFICYLLSIYLTKPLRILERASQQIAAGDLSVRVSQQLHYRQDEIGQLATEFDNMATKVQTMMLSERRLLQDISHELRSPLARLKIALEIARGKTKNMATNELNRIELESERLNELIGEVLSLARMESPEFRLRKESFDMYHLLEELKQDCDYEHRGQQSRINLYGDKHSVMTADRKLIRSAIENILLNALRYTAENKAIEIHLHHDEDEINLSIRDHGPGIDENKISQLFKAFYRVDDARTMDKGGYGLGLAIAAKSIALHHGHISAVNAIGGGLIINIDLPT